MENYDVNEQMEEHLSDKSQPKEGEAWICNECQLQIKPCRDAWDEHQSNTNHLIYTVVFKKENLPGKRKTLVVSKRSIVTLVKKRDVKAERKKNNNLVDLRKAST